ncbi:MAG TPA: cyclic nucleotide-binding domain-containing protein, partial [Methylophilaceae bacterium]
MSSPTIEQLKQLAPIAVLSDARLKELAGLCFIETVSRNLDPLRMNILKAGDQSIYLLKGDLGLRFADGSKKIMRGGTDAASHPINDGRLNVVDTIAITDVDILRIDADLLDIMLTWDQLSGYEPPVEKVQAAKGMHKRPVTEWMRETATFSASKLQSGVFSRLPSANIEEMFRRMETVPVKAGQVVIAQGAEGDYYYLIEQGQAIVSRTDNTTQQTIQLAELHAGDGFGEEALVSDNKRNATVTMKTDGSLLRLKKSDFIELLKEPIVRRVDQATAAEKIRQGAQLLDVRFKSEYLYQHPEGAVSAPLHELRNIA